MATSFTTLGILPAALGGGAAGSITLGTLTLSGSLQIGTATSGTISGATGGSSIAGNIPGITVNSGARTYAGTPTGSAGAISNGLVETLAGATNSPNNSSVTVSAAAAATDQLLPVSGQSNAITSGYTGTTGLPAGWADSARIQYWNGSAFVTYSPGVSPTNWGPEVQYAADWLAANTGTNKLYIVKHAVSGTQLGSWTTYGQSSGAPSDWSITDNDHGSNYLLFLAKMNAATAALSGAGVTVAVPAAMWIQGEADSQLPGALADYTTNCAALWALYRAAPFGDANTKIVIHTPSAGFSAYDIFTMLTKLQALAALAPTKNFVFNTNGLTYQADTIHMAQASINIMGSSIYSMTHGGLIPTGLAYTSSPLGTDSPTNTSAGYLSCSCRDISSAVTWSLVGTSNEFTVATSAITGLATVRVKAGATLTQTTYNITVRATSASGGTADLSVAVVVGAAGTGTWWNAASVVTMDFANDQYRINGTNYLGASALASAPKWSAATNSVDLTGIMPTSFTMLCNGVNSPRAPSNSTPNIMYALDDGADGVATDEIFAVQRGIPSGSGFNMTVNKASAAQVSATSQFVNVGFAPLAFVKTAARGTLNDMNFAVNGTLPVAAADTVCAVPNILRMKLGDRETGGRPWAGDIYRAELLNVATNDAGMVTLTT